MTNAKKKKTVPSNVTNRKSLRGTNRYMNTNTANGTAFRWKKDVKMRWGTNMMNRPDGITARKYLSSAMKAGIRYTEQQRCGRQRHQPPCCNSDSKTAFSRPGAIATFSNGSSSTASSSANGRRASERFPTAP